MSDRTAASSSGLSLTFYPQCFQSMRSGETWTQPDGGGAHLGAEKPPEIVPQGDLPPEGHPGF